MFYTYNYSIEDDIFYIVDTKDGSIEQCNLATLDECKRLGIKINICQQGIVPPKLDLISFIKEDIYLAIQKTRHKTNESLVAKVVQLTIEETNRELHGERIIIIHDVLEKGYNGVYQIIYGKPVLSDKLIHHFNLGFHFVYNNNTNTINLYT